MASLEQYQAKRDFKKTSEPAGKVARGGKDKAGGIFVIHKHAATAAALRSAARACRRALELGGDARAQASIRTRSGSQSMSRTTRWTMRHSRATSPRANMAAAP